MLGAGVLVLCSACSACSGASASASANHAIKNEIAWDDREERRHRQTSV